MDPAAGLWIAWPKRSSGVETDMTEDVARELGLANRLVDNKVCAIDETWSGLRLVIRLEDRASPSRSRTARLLEEVGDHPREPAALPGERRLCPAPR